MLIDHWYSQPSEEASVLYIDGHVRIYYGTQANLPAKFVSRQKLCLSATTEYWVNNASGLPVMMVTGELTENCNRQWTIHHSAAWTGQSFKSTEVKVLEQTTTMQICEQETVLGGVKFR